ncbi:MAG TPA: hypothetical protein PKC45_09035 [Gemmatales bacterium]|nr:hypothetical protein [Gemmatales bacterium]
MLPPDAILVITDNLRQALAQMRAGSIVLSPERYQGLMEELARLRRERGAAPEFVFATARITGRVEQLSGQLRALLRIELAFRTSTPGQKVPLPLRGLQLTDARLDGEVPSWRMERDQLILQLAEPRAHRLILEGWCGLETRGDERRLVLERVPSALITSFELTTSRPALQAVLRAGPRLTVEPAGTNGSKLLGEGLGPVTQIDVSWRELDPDAPPSPLIVSGLLRHAFVGGRLESDLRLRFEGGRDPVPEVRVRLGVATENLEAEALGTAGGEPIPVAVVAEANGILLRLPQPWQAAAGPLQLRLRGTSPLPPGAVSLGVAEVTQPPEARQTGIVVVRLDPDTAVRLVPGNVLPADPRDVPEREVSGSVSAFRYARQPARLDAFLEPVRLEPAADVRLTHIVRLSRGRAVLACEFEFLRLARLNVAEVVMSVPPGWRLDRRILLQPLIAYLDEAPGRIRIQLQGRTASPFRLRLEGDLAGGESERVNFELPRILEVREEPGRQAAAVQLVVRSERVVLEGEEVHARLDAGTSGLIDEQNRPPSLEGVLRLPMVLIVGGPPRQGGESVAPPRLALFWQSRQPTVTAAAEVFVDESTVTLRQAFTYAWATRPPERLTWLLPAEVEPEANVLFQPDTQTNDPPLRLPALIQRRGESAELVVEVPPRVGRSSKITITSHQPFRRPMEGGPLSLRWLRPLQAEVKWDAGWPVAVWSTRSVPLKSTFPSVASNDGYAVQPRALFRMLDWESELPIQVERGRDAHSSPVADGQPSLVVELCQAQVQPLSEVTARCRWSLEISQTSATRLAFRIPSAPSRVTAVLVLVDGSQVPHEFQGGSDGSAEVIVPLDRAALQRRLRLVLDISFEGMASRWGVRTLPRLELPPGSVVAETHWHLSLEADQWLVDAAVPIASPGDGQGQWLLRRAGPPVTLTWRAVSAPIWRTACSVGLVLAVLVGLLAGRPWPWLIAFGLLALAVSIVNPWMLRQAVLGATPGIPVAMLILGVHLWRQRRPSPSRVISPHFRWIAEHQLPAHEPRLAETPLAARQEPAVESGS